MTHLVPPIGAKGRFTAATPFEVNQGVIYQCTALRRFSDIEKQQLRVYETFYAPFGLPQDAVSRDRSNGVYIVTLESETHAPLYIPTSYITSYPDGAYRNYQRIVISAELGPLPDYMDLTFLQASMKALVSDTTGVEPYVALAIAPMTTQVTPGDHEQREIARVNAIKRRDTDYARFLAERQKNQRLEARVSMLEDILRQHGVIPQ